MRTREGRCTIEDSAVVQTDRDALPVGDVLRPSAAARGERGRGCSPPTWRLPPVMGVSGARFECGLGSRFADQALGRGFGCACALDHCRHPRCPVTTGIRQKVELAYLG